MSSKTKKILSQVEETLDMKSGYKNLRNHIRDNPHGIPYLGLTLTDLTFIHDGNAKMLENNMINLWMVKLQYVIVRGLIETKRDGFERDEEVIEIVKRVMSENDKMTEDERFRQSLLLEPRRQ